MKTVRWLVNGVLMGLILAQAVDAFGQTLQPVTSGDGFPWWIVIVAAVTILAVAGMIIWHKRNPSAQAQAMTEAHTALAGVASGLHGLVSEIVAKKEMQTSVGPAEAWVIGKSGTPGEFRINVTGDPKADLPAINAQYFG